MNINKRHIEMNTVHTWEELSVIFLSDISSVSSYFVTFGRKHLATGITRSIQKHGV